MICNRCNKYLNVFQSFKTKIILSRQGLVQELEIKDEPDEEVDEHQLNVLYADREEPETVFELFDDSISPRSHDRPNIRQVLHFQSELNSKTESAHKELLKKFKPKFVKGGSEKPTKSPRVLCPFPSCSKTITFRALPTHMKTHDSNRERSFMCEICSKTYLNKHELIIHRR